MYVLNVLAAGHCCPSTYPPLEKSLGVFSFWLLSKLLDVEYFYLVGF